MGDKSPKSKQRNQKQKKRAKERIATEAKSKQDRQRPIQTATKIQGK